MFFGKLF